MKNIRFWIPAIIGALVTPVCLYFIGASASGSGAAGHAGAGMGAMLLFYPLPSLVSMLSGEGTRDNALLSLVLSRLAFAAMILQFPVYGFVISYANHKRRLWLGLCAGVAWLHLFVIIVCLLLFFIWGLL
jgi:hypothetical protein